MFAHRSDSLSSALSASGTLNPLQVSERTDTLDPRPLLKFSNHSSSEVLDRAWQEVTTRLSQFASAPSFTSKMNVAFGTDWSLADAQNLFKGWSVYDFQDFPQVEVSRNLDIIGANGAYAGETNTIYLSSNFLAQNTDHPDVVAGVLLEEIGHAIDFRINKYDAAGDEGDIFSRLVRGVALTANELGLLKMENDATTVVWNGKSLQIEQSSTLEVAQNIDGRLEEFTIEKGTNNVSFRWQLVPNGVWSDWATMQLNGSEFKGKELEVVENADGRLELFVIGLDNKVWQTWQTVPSGLLGWSKPVEFGLQATEIEVSRNKDGRLEAFAIDMSGELKQKWQTKVNSSWTGWNNFGLKASEIDVVQNQDGRLEIFGIGTDGEVWKKWQYQPNGVSGWSGWDKLGLKAKDIEVVRNKDGHLEAFAIGTDGEVWQKWQTKVNGGWTGWNNFGLKASEIEVTQNQDGRLEIFGIRTDGEVFQRWQQKPNGAGGWSNWTQFGLKAVEIEAARNADGRLELFAVDAGAQTQQRWQLQSNGTTGWSQWYEQSDIKAVGEDEIPGGSSFNGFSSPVRGTGFKREQDFDVYNKKAKGYHAGIDILPPTGAKNDIEIYAVGKGKVIYANGKGTVPDNKNGNHGFGNTIIIEHTLLNGKKIWSQYSHMKYGSLKVTVGQEVNENTVIGIMGNTGYSFGRHLHFELEDPDTYKKEGASTLMGLGYPSKHPTVYGALRPDDFIKNLPK